MINDFKVGTLVECSLAVKSAEIKLTKQNKKYLALELFDGTDTIKGNAWDWEHNAPKPNTVVDIAATVGEWMGAPQLTFSKVRPSKTSILEFAPQGPVGMEFCVRKWNVLAHMITSTEVKKLVMDVFSEYAPLWLSIPGAVSVHHAYVGGTLHHTVEVAGNAAHIAKQYPQANFDLVVAGAMLHDVGKLKAYQLDGIEIGNSLEGELLGHIVLGIKMIEKFRTEHNSGIVDLVQHIIASHHGKIEYGSPVLPKSLEAFIVHFADNLDAKADIIRQLNESSTGGLTKKEWTLGNSQMLTYDLVKGMMGNG